MHIRDDLNPIQGLIDEGSQFKIKAVVAKPQEKDGSG